MKVLQISNYYSPHIGGIEQVARDCAEALEGKCEQRVLCFAHEKGTSADTVDGVPVVRAGCFAKVSSQPLSFCFGKLLKKQFKEFSPDVVVFHFPNPFGAHYLLKLLKKYPKCRLVVYYHLDITRQKFLGKFFRKQTERLLCRAARVIATSPNYAESSPFLRRVSEKCDLVPNCVDEARLALDEEAVETARRLREAHAGETICFAVGRHVEYKGLRYLIEACASLGKRYRIWIGGEGPLTEELMRKAHGDARIEFTGKLTDEELKARLLACDIFCFPSITRNEAFGLALAEAMWFSKPSVTFTIPGSGVNYVNLNGVTGIEVENSDAESYAAAIERLAADPALREKYGRAARERVEQLFTFAAFAENFNEVVRRAAL